MWSKYFFERFWEGEQKNELFVCMPFHKDFDERFREIIDPAAKEAGFDKAIRIDQTTESEVITDKIWNGIANSKMILVDLTDDPKSGNHVNGNVLLELGVAQSMREPTAVVIIRDQDPGEADFDVRGLTINRSRGGALTKDWLVDLLKDSISNYDWSESKRVKAAAESIDDTGLYIMYKTGRLPRSFRHFNTHKEPVEVKLAVIRLMDLGIIRIDTGGISDPTEYAYHWTSFGDQVMNHLGMQIMTHEEFEKIPGYSEIMEGHNRFMESKKQKEETNK